MKMMKEILIIEDNIILQNMMQFFMEREGYRVDGALSGKEALALVEKSTYDFIVVDLMLPYYNGLEIIEQVRASKRNAQTGIMIVSDLSDDNIIKDGFAVGANDFLKKPVSPSELLTRINYFLR